MMAVPTQAELLRVGGAAFVATIIWGDSASLRALVMGVAAVSAFMSLADSSGSLFKSVGKGKAPAEHTPSVAAAPVSTTLNIVTSPFKALARWADTSAFLHILIVSVAALLSSWIVKFLGIPGYPWSAVLLGAFCGWCLRSFSVEEQVCKCGQHDPNDAACPYHNDFWAGLPSADPLHEEDEDDALADIVAKEQEKSNAVLAEPVDTDDEDQAMFDEDGEVEEEDCEALSAYD